MKKAPAWILVVLLGCALTVAAQSSSPAPQQQPAPAPDPAQATPPSPDQLPSAAQPPAAPDASAAERYQPFQPIALKPAAKPDEREVHATGGIITDHPVDALTTQGVYNPILPRSSPIAPPESEPAPVVDDVIATVPDVVTLNQGAASLTYHDRHNGPFNVGTEASWTYTSNIFNDFVDAKTSPGAWFDFAFPAGFTYKSDTTSFGNYFRGDFAHYPGRSELNHNSEIYSQELTHQSSEVTTWQWSLAGGRVVAVEDYLSPVIAVGTTGVGQPSLVNGLAPMYDAATTLSATHRVSERDTVIGSLTGGWLQEPFSEGLGTQIVWNREATGGADLQLQHALNARQSVGAELSNVYIEGLSPAGRGNFASVKATYQQALFTHASLHLGAGPLYSSASSSFYPGMHQLSYSADASLDYRTSFARMTVGAERIIEAGYLDPGSPADRVYGEFDRPLSDTTDLTADVQYIRASVVEQLNRSAAYSDFGVTSRLSRYLTPHMTAFLEGSSFYQGTNLQGTNSNNPGANSVTVGVSWSLGNPFIRTGAR